MIDGYNACTITGTLSALGENADPTQIEGGGGGSGGGIYIQAPNVTLRGVLSGTGGNGGDGGDNGGGGGGGGRLKITCISLDTTGLWFSVAGGQGGYATIGEPGLPGNPGTVEWRRVPGVEEREISDIFGIRSGLTVVPNPSRGECEFRFSSIPRGAPLALELYDPIGRLVRTLDAGPGGPKPTEVIHWDGRDEAGREVSSGVYFYRTRDGRTQGKVLVLR
jgi:hypothetical protein